MARLDCTQESLDGVTLVECRLASEARERVTLEATHEAPIWPPRRQGVPAAGWDEPRWTGVVPADGPLALGYATPAEPSDPPMRIVDSDPPPDKATTPGPRAVIRALGDPRPPRDAVEPDGGQSVECAPSDHRPPNNADPPAIDPEAGLDAIERRLERAERLAAVDSVAAAQSAVDAVGGLEAVRALEDQLDRDRDALDRLRARVGALHDRASVDVPVADLERLV